MKIKYMADFLCLQTNKQKNCYNQTKAQRSIQNKRCNLIRFFIVS